MGSGSVDKIMKHCQYPLSDNLLPTGSEEREVLGVWNIPVAILTSCQYMKTIAL